MFFKYICLLKFYQTEMPCIHYNNFSKSILVVIFLFLNGICIASPAVKNTADNHTQTASLPLGNDLNNVETGENQLPVQSCKQQAALRSVAPANGAGIQTLYNNSAEPDVQNLLNYYAAPSFFLPRPGYYIFLFRYTLF